MPLNIDILRRMRGLTDILDSMSPLKEFFSSGLSLWKEGDFPWTPLLSLIEFLNEMPCKIEIELPEGVHLENRRQISIGRGSVIDPVVFIQGPCFIGRNCQVRHGAYIRGGCYLADGSVVGHGCEVKHSILLPGASAAHLCYVGDSILGEKVNLGAGVKCANLRLDRREIAVEYNGAKVKTGMRKLGAIIGDGSQIGCNCVLNPGTLIGRETISHPLLNLGGTIPARSQVKGARQWTVEPAPEKILEQLLK